MLRIPADAVVDPTPITPVTFDTPPKTTLRIPSLAACLAARPAANSLSTIVQ
jgi:hypothetical protein